VDCLRAGVKDGSCNNCVQRIVWSLMRKDFVLPDPDLCQDAAYIAWVLDERLKVCRAAGERIRGEL